MPGASDHTARTLGSLASEIMDVLWASDKPLTVRTVMDRVNAARAEPLAYTTVMTVLSRLAARGYLERKAVRRAFFYQPVVQDRADLAVLDVLRTYGETAVTHFVDRARADPAFLERLHSLIRDDEAK